MFGTARSANHSTVCFLKGSVRTHAGQAYATLRWPLCMAVCLEHHSNGVHFWLQLDVVHIKLFIGSLGHVRLTVVSLLSKHLGISAACVLQTSMRYCHGSRFESLALRNNKILLCTSQVCAFMPAAAHCSGNRQASVAAPRQGAGCPFLS